jgi:outer membrane protein OmpA-like peptidoglycan-associated protein
MVMYKEKDGFLSKLLFAVLFCSLIAVIGTALGVANQDSTSVIQEDQYVLVSTIPERSTPLQEDPETQIRKKQKQEKAALASYARKIQAEIKSANRIAEKFDAISVHLVRDGFAVDLRHSRAGSLFESDSTILTPFASELLNRAASYLVPFKNQLEVFSYSSPTGVQDDSDALALASQRAFAVREALLGSGINTERVKLVGARTAPLARSKEDREVPKHQVLVLMRYTDFQAVQPKSEQTEVEELFRSFDKRSVSPPSAPSSYGTQKNTQMSTSPQSSDELQTRTRSPLRKPVPQKDKIFGSNPVFAPRDPLNR